MLLQLWPHSPVQFSHKKGKPLIYNKIINKLLQSLCTLVAIFCLRTPEYGKLCETLGEEDLSNSLN